MRKKVTISVFAVIALVVCVMGYYLHRMWPMLLLRSLTWEL